MVHELKIRPGFATAVLEGRKTFEVRYNDRGYQVGDVLEFRCYDGMMPCSHGINGRRYIVTYVMNEVGLKEGYVVLAIKEEEWATTGAMSR